MMHEINITEIKNIKIGHAENIEAGTGCTVIICEKGMTAGVDVRGSAPASRETDLLDPVNMVQQIHGVMLSGGSAYGLDAASGAMQFLEEKGFGFDVGVGVVPIVCASSLFDLDVADSKIRPDKDMGYKACENAYSGKALEEGNVGAGTGATVGKMLGYDRSMKSGIGTYAVKLGDLVVGAVVAVNALGDIIDINTGKVIAGLLNEEKNAFIGTEKTMYEEYTNLDLKFGKNTTIGCVISNAKVTKADARNIAKVAHNGYARAIRPVHTSFDGDTIYSLNTGEIEVKTDVVSMLAAEVMARAINKAAFKAEKAYGLLTANEFSKR